MKGFGFFSLLCCVVSSLAAPRKAGERGKGKGERRESVGRAKAGERGKGKGARLVDAK